jgi:hypothetical protein
MRSIIYDLEPIFLILQEAVLVKSKRLLKTQLKVYRLQVSSFS